MDCATCTACGWSAAAASPEHSNELMARHRGACPGREGAKHDAEKIRLDLLPPTALERVGEVLTYGAKKYAPENWRKVPDYRRRYTAAALRHLLAWMKGEPRDLESGLPHLAHAACCLLFILDLDKQP